MDYEKEIISLQGRAASMEADIRNLVGWQHTQNGTITRVDKKVDKLLFWMIGTAAGAALSFLATIVTLLVVISTRG